MNIKSKLTKIIKKIISIILFGTGIFFLMGMIYFVSKGDASGIVIFGIITFICLFLSRGLVIEYFENNKVNRMKKKEEQMQKIKDIEVELKKKELDREYEIKKYELDHQDKIKKIQEENALKIKVNKEIVNMDHLEDGYAFEYYVAGLLENNNYNNVKVTSASNDYGIDVLAEKDGIKYAIQCKYYTQPVGNKAVQEAYSGKAFYNCHIAVVATNNVFTDNAINLAQKNGVLLWDRSTFEEMINHTLSNSNA